MLSSRGDLKAVHTFDRFLELLELRVDSPEDGLLSLRTSTIKVAWFAARPAYTYWYHR